MRPGGERREQGGGDPACAPPARAGTAPGRCPWPAGQAPRPPTCQRALGGSGSGKGGACREGLRLAAGRRRLGVPGAGAELTSGAGALRGLHAAGGVWEGRGRRRCLLAQAPQQLRQRLGPGSGRSASGQQPGGRGGGEEPAGRGTQLLPGPGPLPAPPPAAGQVRPRPDPRAPPAGPRSRRPRPAAPSPPPATPPPNPRPADPFPPSPAAPPAADHTGPGCGLPTLAWRPRFLRTHWAAAQLARSCSPPGPCVRGPGGAGGGAGGPESGMARGCLSEHTRRAPDSAPCRRAVGVPSLLPVTLRRKSPSGEGAKHRDEPSVPMKTPPICAASP
ncbi:uncharacterized protein LOC144580568 isoform X6 [Callithrix jacchus]